MWTLITGGAKRLGAEICLALAKENHNIVIHYQHSKEEALNVVEKCKAFGVQATLIQGDFSTVESTQAFAKRYLKEFPLTKNIIHNVGNYFQGSPLQTPIHHWIELFQNNLYAPLILTQYCVEALKQHQGVVIHIGIAGIQHIRADTHSTAYACAKTGLWMLTKSLALELAPHCIRVNMVSPGYLNNSVDLPEHFKQIPMQRTGLPEEVATVVAFLLSDEAAYITGQNIEVAGGVRL